MIDDARIYYEFVTSPNTMLISEQKDCDCIDRIWLLGELESLINDTLEQFKESEDKAKISWRTGYMHAVQDIVTKIINKYEQQ